MDTHPCQKYIYKHIYMSSFITRKWLNSIYLRTRPFSTQLRIYTVLRREGKKKKLKSVNTQIFPLTRCPFSASLHFTSDFLLKLRASDNSAHFFLLERSHPHVCWGRSCSWILLGRESVNKYLLNPWSTEHCTRYLELSLSSGEARRWKL